MNYNNIPDALKIDGKFCVWKRGQIGERMTKVPYNPRTGGKAQSNNPNSFTDFNFAVGSAQSGQYSGIGIGIFDDVCAIDIDHCVNGGELSEMAQDIINTINAYTEYSPSGEGVRILFTAKDFIYDKAVYYINNQKLGLEVYVAGATNKFVTVTGNVITAGQYGDRTSELQIVLDKYMKRLQPQKMVKSTGNQQLSNLSDVEILQKAEIAKNGAKFRALYRGDTSGYPSQSEADLALCGLLAFWCGRDATQMDRIFRSSGLFRDKWDRQQSGSTYGSNVIQKAIDNCADVYTPPAKRKLQPQTATQQATENIPTQNNATQPQSIWGLPLVDQSAIATLCATDPRQRKFGIEAAQLLLQAFDVTIRFNDMNKNVEIKGLPPEYSGEDSGNLLVTLISDAAYQLSFKRASSPVVHEVLTVVAYKNHYHPVMELLKSEPWDEVDRLPELYRIMGLSDNFHEILVRKWALQTIAVLYNTEDLLYPPKVF